MTESGRVLDAGAQPGSDDASGDMDLYYYLQVLGRHRLLVGGAVLAAVLVSAVVALLLPPEYEAETTLLPVSGSSSSRLSSLLGNLGPLAELPGLADAVPEEGSDLLINVLESRSVAERVIAEQGLEPLLAGGEDEGLEDAVEAFRRDVLSVSDNNRGLITVTARFRDPETAARVANAAVKALDDFLKRNKVTAAARTRDFLALRLSEVGLELEAAEEALRVFCEKNGVISIPDQTRLLFEQIAALSSEVALKRARMEVLQKFGGASNPEVTRLEAEIQSLQTEILDLEHGVRRGKGPMIESNGFIPLYHVPEKSLLFTRLTRDVRVKQEVQQYLQTENEAARIRQSSEEIAFTLLDAATAPKEPVRPKPLLIVSLSAVFSGLAAFLLASFLEYLERRRKGPAAAAAGGAPGGRAGAAAPIENPGPVL